MNVTGDFDEKHFVNVHLVVRTEPSAMVVNSDYEFAEGTTKNPRQIIDLMLADVRSTIKSNTAGFVTQGFQKPFPVTGGMDSKQPGYLVYTVVYYIRERS